MIPESTARYGILVGVDGSPESEAAIGWATKEAIMRDQTLTLMHAIAPVEAGWPMANLAASFAESQEVSARDAIEKAQKTVQASADQSQPPTVHTEVRHTDAPSALVIASRHAYMTVVGSRGMGSSAEPFSVLPAAV